MVSSFNVPDSTCEEFIAECIEYKAIITLNFFAQQQIAAITEFPQEIALLGDLTDWIIQLAGSEYYSVRVVYVAAFNAFLVADSLLTLVSLPPV